ncbi:MAG: DUF885 domain-containing protein [Acidimicrobiia bacterium]
MPDTSETYEIADAYVDRAAALDPVAATFRGLAGHDAEMTDYSPDGFEERVEHARAGIRRLDTTVGTSETDRVAAEVMRADLVLDVDQYEAGEHFRLLRVLGSPVQAVRQCFDLMPTDTEHDWEAIAARLGVVPQGLSTIQATLEEGVRQNLVSPRRQVVACVQQAETWSGTDDASSRPFFTGLVERFDSAGIERPALRSNLAQRAERATAAYAAFARYLADEYSPHADAPDAVGPERYALFSRSFNGIDLDLAETYAWGWDELYRIEHAMGEVAERILPGTPLSEVIAHLESDPNRVIEGVDAFQRWLQDLMDQTIAELDGTHFDIPEPVRQVEAMIAPPGGAAAMYYTGPSEDFSRPGRTWYPTLGKTRFPLWGEVSICYHEGVPGHHLQIAQVRYLADRLSRYQRTLAGSSGHAEGWALYAERLMGELGYLDDPAYELGMLRAQAMRAVRVVVDIGMHLELPIPERELYHGGETWTPEIALPFVIERSRFPVDFMRSEVDRYLGMPAQAISYKVGERVWLGARDAAKAHAGASFDLKEFHRHALDLGPMGLAQLERELTPTP